MIVWSHSRLVHDEAWSLTMLILQQFIESMDDEELQKTHSVIHEAVANAMQRLLEKQNRQTSRLQPISKTEPAHD